MFVWHICDLLVTNFCLANSVFDVFFSPFFFPVVTDRCRTPCTSGRAHGLKDAMASVAESDGLWEALRSRSDSLNNVWYSRRGEGRKGREGSQSECCTFCHWHGHDQGVSIRICIRIGDSVTCETNGFAQSLVLRPSRRRLTTPRCARGPCQRPQKSRLNNRPWCPCLMPRTRRRGGVGSSASA